jgi:hypothetical protein
MKFHYHFSTCIYFRLYSLAHDKEIVDFVVRHGVYDMVKGNVLWKKMEAKKVRQTNAAFTRVPQVGQRS